MSKRVTDGPSTVAVVGAGHRSRAYCRYALKHPDRMKVVAVVDPNDLRRNRLADEHGVPTEHRFTSHAALVERPGLAEAVVNGTMDRLHHATALPLIEAGYHMLLEKPISPFEHEVRELIEAAEQHKRTVMICHVLRYAPFYAAAKRLVEEGRIGEIVAIRTSEQVAHHHYAVAFIRGRWNNRDTSAPCLLAKCCHDLDLIAWFMSGVPVTRVSSFGSLTQFKPENAPKGAADRCLDGCKVERTCAYSAKRNYVEQGLWGTYAFEPIEHLENPTDEQKLESLRTDNPWGRCVWHCDNNVVDHQNVIVEFANGVTATHDLFAATPRGTRTLHILGTDGEIDGDFSDGKLLLRTFDLASRDCRTETIDLNIHGDEGDSGHGGGDERLVADFVATLRGEATSRATTRIQDSLTGHLIAFAADDAMLNHRVVEFDEADVPA